MSNDNSGHPIKDNPSNKKIREEMQGMETLLKVGNLFGLVDNETLSKIDSMRSQFEVLATTPDEFNRLFADMGWIAYETMNQNIMEKAVALANGGDLKAAEEEILNYYRDISNISFIISRGSSVKPFLMRKQLALYAKNEYADGHYYSCIPLLLMIIDGIVNDISQHTGFFARNTDVTSWDSIAGHYSGLTKIKGIYNQSRTTTSTDEIRMPYRNGILHGRDINFNNIYVAAKCWGCLAAVIVWGKDVLNGRKDAPTT